MKESRAKNQDKKTRNTKHKTLKLFKHETLQTLQTTQNAKPISVKCTTY